MHSAYFIAQFPHDDPRVTRMRCEATQGRLGSLVTGSTSAMGPPESLQITLSNRLPHHSSSEKCIRTSQPPSCSHTETRRGACPTTQLSDGCWSGGSQGGCGAEKRLLLPRAPTSLTSCCVAAASRSPTRPWGAALWRHPLASKLLGQTHDNIRTPNSPFSNPNAFK